MSTALAPTTATRYVLTRDWFKQSMARAIPGAWFCGDEKAWVLEDPDPRAAAVALKLFPELALQHPALGVLRDTLASEVRPFDRATEYGRMIHERAPHVFDELAREDKHWFEYQDLDLGYVADVLETHGGAYIGWSRGLGKTLGACSLIDALDCKRVLVVSPNTAKESVWRAEIERFLPDHKVFVLPNAKAKRERQLSILPGQKGYAIHSDRGTLAHPDVPFVLVVHYEALQILDKAGWWKKLGEWDLVIADEAHRLKNTQALMTKAIKRIPSKRRLALSGSIIQNHIEELFSVLQWLFPKRYKAKWRDWNDRYLDYVESSFGRVCVGVKPDRIEQMRDELSRFMVVRYKEDELDLPDKTEQTLYVELSTKQRRAYNELVDECLARLDDGTVVKAAEGLTLLTRLRQVATGLDLLGHDVTDSSKLDMALELIEDNPDEAFVVFSWFKAAAHSLAKRLSEHHIGCFVCDGDVPHEARSSLIERFQSGEGRVFVGTISTAGESINLFRANNAIFLDRSWVPTQNAQAEDRIYRIGQSRPVTITHLIARDTVDEYRVQPALANKDALRRAVLGGRA